MIKLFNEKPVSTPDLDPWSPHRRISGVGNDIFADIQTNSYSFLFIECVILYNKRTCALVAFRKNCCLLINDVIAHYGQFIWANDINVIDKWARVGSLWIVYLFHMFHNQSRQRARCTCRGITQSSHIWVLDTPFYKRLSKQRCLNLLGYTVLWILATL